MRRITLFLVSFLIWYLLAWPYDIRGRSMDWQMLAAGLVFALAACLLFVEVFTRFPHKFFAPVRYFWALVYLPLLFYYMLAANLDVVYRVVHPRLPIRPGIIKVKTSLTSESGRTALANSITLTPGTLTVDITDEGVLYIHWINVRDDEAAAARIVGRFEKILARIFD